MAAEIYDAIVVGTGAGGGTAMKILCEAGLQVCAINSGPRTDPGKDYRLHRQPYDLKYRGYGDPLRLKGKAHQEPYSVEESEYSEGRDLFEHDVAYSNAPISVTVQFTPTDTVHLDLSYPIQTRKGDTTLAGSQASAEIPLRYELLYKTAVKLITQIDHAQPNTYLINQHCAEYATPDKLLNIYLHGASADDRRAIEIVDASPTQKGLAPLRFQFETQGERVSGVCVG